jgi:hypothetical protein
VAGSYEVSTLTDDTNVNPAPTDDADSPGDRAPADDDKSAKPKDGEPEEHPEGSEPKPTSPPRKPKESDDDKSEKKDGDKREEQDRRPYLDRIRDEERDWRRRQENLRDPDWDEVTGRPGGDWVGGDSNQAFGGSIYTAGRDLKLSLPADEGRAQIWDLPLKDVEQLRECLVAPPSQAELKDVLSRQTLLFLRGTVGTGRFTAALDALLTWATADDGDTSPAGVIVGVRPPFHRMKVDLRPGHGYVLEVTETGEAWDLGTLARFLGDLADKGDSRVIILVSSVETSVPAYVVDHRAPPAPEVFSCWLDHEAGKAGVDRGLFDEMSQEIGDDLMHETSPWRATHLARRLVSGIKAGRPIDELRAELPQQLRVRIRDRLGEGTPVLGRCFMTSVAVLNGLVETTVSEAALALAEQIKKVDSIKPEDPLPAWEQLHTWLDYAAATTSLAQAAGGGRTVHLMKRRAESITLRVLWEDYPTIREPLIAWLKDLAEDAVREPVRMKAAHAVGILATFDFDVAKARFLDPWIRSRRLRDHRLAAMMLESAARDPDILARVLELLRIWTDGGREKRLVVANAYGSDIGLLAPRAALRDLRRIAYGRDTEVSKAVAGSLGILYSRETSAEILKELVTWASGDSIGALYTSALAFIRLAQIGGGDPARPPLTGLEESPELLARLAVLWRNALGLRLINSRTEQSNLAAPDSWTVLAKWLSRYDDEPVIRAVIGEILARSSSRGRLRNAFILNLWQWQRRNLISLDLRERLTALMRGA